MSGAAFLRPFVAGLCLLMFVVTSQVANGQNKVSFLSVPGYDRFAKIEETGKSVLPSGRLVTPAGDVLRITHDPFGLAISPDQMTAVTLHDAALSIIDLKKLSAISIPDLARPNENPLLKGSFMGVAFHPRKSVVYLSGGDEGTVVVFDYVQRKKIATLSLNGVFQKVKYVDSFTSDLIYNDAKNELLILDRGNFRLVRYDLGSNKITASIPTGRQPFGLSISPDHKTVVVANVGMYAYPIVEGTTPENLQSQYIPWHPYGNNTTESINGTVIEGKKIPGVGDPNAPESMSIYCIDLATNQVKARLKTGMLLGEFVEDAEVVGGASPNSIVIGSTYAYVTNATNDNIAVIDYREGKIVRHMPIHVDARIDKFRGLLPFGIDLSKDGKSLYVALLGFNAVAKLDANTGETLGLIPTGWGPTRVKLSADDATIYIASCRGLGAGPNGGRDFKKTPVGTYIGDVQLATFQKVSNPNTSQLQEYTARVIQNTFIVKEAEDNGPVPVLPGSKESPIKHIVFINKENRTYDEIFGQFKTANGDSTLARYGLGVDIADKRRPVKHVNVTPNHHKIARQFSLSDNFYCDSDASIHGHHWMMGVIPNEWVEANSSTDKRANYFSPAPGRRFPGSTGSMDPEDYAEIGGLWEALERKHLEYYNFGEANETAHVREAWYDTATGASHIVMVPMQKGLWKRTSHNYAGFNTNIPDQFRARQFETEFTRLWLTGKDTLPSLIAIQLPNDHGADVRPADGYRYPHSFMADNDLALGRMLHFLSRTPYWKNMLVIITEDDPQGGVDHVDAHRSVLMMAGPYVKRNYVSHTHANFGSLLKVIYNTLGVPYVNQYDVTASLVSDFFTNEPDYTPYYFEFPSQEVFDWDRAMKKYKQDIDWRKIKQGPQMDDEDDQRREHKKGE